MNIPVERDIENDTLNVTMPAAAKVGWVSGEGTYFAMPTNSEYKGLIYRVPTNWVTTNGDRTVTVKFPRDKGASSLLLRKSRLDFDVKLLPIDDAEKTFSASSMGDLTPDRYFLSVPWDAVTCYTPQSGYIETGFPVGSKYGSDPKFGTELIVDWFDDLHTTEKNIAFTIPDAGLIDVRAKKTEKISVREYITEMQRGMFREVPRMAWERVSAKAVIKSDGDDVTLRMPDGKFEGWTYTLPVSTRKTECADKNGMLDFMLPMNTFVDLKSPDGEKRKMSLIRFLPMTDSTDSGRYAYAETKRSVERYSES